MDKVKGIWGCEHEPTDAVQVSRRLVYPPNHSLSLLLGLKVLESRESNSGIRVTVYPSSWKRGVLTLMPKQFRCQTATKPAVFTWNAIVLSKHYSGCTFHSSL